MTSDNTRTTPDVRLRVDGEVDEETVAYARAKIDAVVGRPGLPDVTGEVRITRSAVHHADRPWSAAAELRVGGDEVVVLAEEATGREVVDQLKDRLRRRTEQVAHSGHSAHHQAPPWRGGPAPHTPTALDGAGLDGTEHDGTGHGGTGASGGAQGAV
jgi:hypothetical protein